MTILVLYVMLLTSLIPMNLRNKEDMSHKFPLK